MDFLDLNTLLSIVGVLSGPAAGIYAFYQSRSKAATDEMDKLDERIGKLEQLVHDHEGVLKNLPTRDSLHELQIAIERMNSDVRVQGETLRGVKETSNLMREWLVKESGK